MNKSITTLLTINLVLAVFVAAILGVSVVLNAMTSAEALNVGGKIALVFIIEIVAGSVITMLAHSRS